MSALPLLGRRGRRPLRFARCSTATLSYHDTLHFIQRVILSGVEVLRSGLSEAKPRSDSDEGIHEGYTIAFLLGVTFCGVIKAVTLRTKAIGIPYEIPLRLTPCAFACSDRDFGNLPRKSAVFNRRKISRYSPKASSCFNPQKFDYGLRPSLRMTRRGFACEICYNQGGRSQARYSVAALLTRTSPPYGYALFPSNILEKNFAASPRESSPKGASVPSASVERYPPS